MRIEKREDGEWLVGAVGWVNDCRERSRDKNRHICTRHLDGEHISCSKMSPDGALKIEARWPIESKDRPEEGVPMHGIDIGSEPSKGVVAVLRREPDGAVRTMKVFEGPDAAARAREYASTASAEDAAPGKPASPTPRFLTPVEARVAQAPYVAREIERINAGLAMGVRSFSVNAPLFEEVKRGLWTAEWSVNGALTMDGRTSFVVRAREEGE